MNPFKRKAFIGLAVLIFTMGMAALKARAEEAPATPPASADTDKSFRDRVAYWKKLKQENPDEFKRLAEARKTEMKQRLQEWKVKNPEKFEAFRQQRQRHQFGKLNRLERENPAKFQEFLQKHPRLSERWEHSKAQRAAWRDRREDFRDRREDYRDRREDFRDARREYRPRPRGRVKRYR